MTESDIDIKEGILRQKDGLLNALLFDRTTMRNIIWATDSYAHLGEEFSSARYITPKLVTGKYGTLIQPRAAKNFDEQQRRTKEKGEVFTPLYIIDQMNKAVDSSGKFRRVTKNNWQEYVQQLRLEITCGEAPFIVSRYNPTAHTGKLIKLDNRVGFLDRKLRVVSKYCHQKKNWLYWAKEAFKASYGYEWQGDNVLLARENLLYTFIDFYKEKFNRQPTLKMQTEFAEIISWNIFQMDGLRYVVPMSCHEETEVIPSQATLFGQTPQKIEMHECEGCKYNNRNTHNGTYVKIMDWNDNQVIRFVDLINQCN